MMHLAAQYLATAAISFLEAEKDDSHTNIGFDAKEGYLYSRSFGAQSYFMSLSYIDFSLNFHGPDSSVKFLLDGKSHKEVVSWISNYSSQVIASPGYKFALHYELPYPLDDEFVFQLTDPDQLAVLLRLRILAHEVCHDFLAQNNFKSDIRIWPHHFDTGIYFELDVDDKQLGMGLAIPDSMIDDHYFYVGGYDAHGPIAVSGFEDLKVGTWIDEGFQGAVVRAANKDFNTILNFLNEAKDKYLN